MINSTLIFDLDDTLIDTKIRHFRLVKDYVSGNGEEFFAYQNYLDIRKASGLSNLQLIKKYYTSLEEGFNEFWQVNIESKNYLKYDIEIASKKLLTHAQEKANCLFIVLSLRSNISLAREQFACFSFASLFDEVFFIPHSSGNPKADYLCDLKKKYQNIMFVGDSINDATAATQAAVGFSGVLTGFYAFNGYESFPDINHFLLKYI